LFPPHYPKRNINLSEDPKNFPRFVRLFSSVERSTAHNRLMGYPQVPGSIPADVVFVYEYIFRSGSWWIISDSFVPVAQWIRSRHLTEIWVIYRSWVRFRPKPRELKSIWIWVHRPSSKCSKLLFPVIKANQIKSDMAHVWMSHGTRMNESWHTYEWVM